MSEGGVEAGFITVLLKLSWVAATVVLLMLLLLKESNLTVEMSSRYAPLSLLLLELALCFRPYFVDEAEGIREPFEGTELLTSARGSGTDSKEVATDDMERRDMLVSLFVISSSLDGLRLIDCETVDCVLLTLEMVWTSS